MQKSKQLSQSSAEMQTNFKGIKATLGTTFFKFSEVKKVAEGPERELASDKYYKATAQALQTCLIKNLCTSELTSFRNKINNELFKVR